MGALLDPVNRAMGGIKWGLVAHTVTMLAFVTIYTAIILNMQFISFVDNRGFPGTITDVAIPPGPIGYQWFIRFEAIGVVPSVMLSMNAWLADGLLVSAVNLAERLSYVDHSSSSIVVTPFML